jgi:hypothetical protein
MAFMLMDPEYGGTVTSGRVYSAGVEAVKVPFSPGSIVWRLLSGNAKVASSMQRPKASSKGIPPGTWNRIVPDPYRRDDRGGFQTEISKLASHRPTEGGAGNE